MEGSKHPFSGDPTTKTRKVKPSTASDKTLREKWVLREGLAEIYQTSKWL